MLFTEETKFDHVFLDMDGVLCDFVSAAMEMHGKFYDAATYPKGEWGIEKVLGISKTQFWKEINGNVGFWESLKAFDHTNQLMTTAYAAGKSVSILTAAARDPSGACHSGKVRWMAHFGRHAPLITCEDKWLLSAPGRLLIDDNDTNCAKWREKGGDAILFPQPWNSLHEMAGMQMVYVGAELQKLAMARFNAIAPPPFAARTLSPSEEGAKSTLGAVLMRTTAGDRTPQEVARMIEEEPVNPIVSEETIAALAAVDHSNEPF